MTRHGWTLLFHVCLRDQLATLQAAADTAQQRASHSGSDAATNANVKLFAALAHLMLEVIPADPSRDVYRLGNTMGPALRHWRRAKIGRRFRLFFRFDTTARIIVYAWVNDTTTLRAAGSKRDPYRVFQRMVQNGNPPDDWAALIAASAQDWPEMP